MIVKSLVFIIILCYHMEMILYSTDPITVEGQRALGVGSTLRLTKR